MIDRIIDLSGYMFSGKSAVSDLLREFEGFHIPNYRSEFDLLRIGGGLIDLKNAVLDWSPVRSYAAFLRFKRLVKQIAGTPRFPRKLFETGWGYDKIYPNILSALDRFSQNITELEWQTPWPYEDLNDGAVETLVRKLRSKSRKYDNRAYALLSSDKFMRAAQEFVQELLWYGVDRQQYHSVVVHNALEPFSPEKNLDLLGENAKCIVVDRDPRDIYATAVTSQVGFNDNLEFYRRIAGAQDVDVFIKRFSIYRNNTNGSEPRILRLRFEELLFDYEETIGKIRAYLGIPASDHKDRGKYFQIEKSKSNCGLWKDCNLSRFEADFMKIHERCGP